MNYKIIPFSDFEKIYERTFQEIYQAKNKWRKINPEEKEELKKNFYNLIQIAYAPVGGHVKVRDEEDILKNIEWNAWVAVDIDDDPEADVVSFGKKTRHGIKLAGAGHDGEKQSKREYLDTRGEMLKKRGFFIEVSGKIAQILLKKYKVPYVDNPKKVEEVIGKKVEWAGLHPEGKEEDPTESKGWYGRRIGKEGEYHYKILVGRPK